MSLAEDQYVDDEVRRREAAEAELTQVEGSPAGIKGVTTDILPGLSPQQGLLGNAWNLMSDYLFFYMMGEHTAMQVGSIIGEQGAAIIAYYAARNHPGLRWSAEFVGNILGGLYGNRLAKAWLLKNVGKEVTEEALNAIERTLSEEQKGKIIDLNKQMELAPGMTERQAPEMVPQRQLELPYKEPVLTPSPSEPEFISGEEAEQRAAEGKQPGLPMNIPTPRQIKNGIYKLVKEDLDSESDEHAEKQIKHANQLSKAGQAIYTQFVNATLLWTTIPGMKLMADVINSQYQALARSYGVTMMYGPEAGLRTAQAAYIAWKDTLPEALKFAWKSFREDRPAWTEDVLKLHNTLRMLGIEQSESKVGDLSQNQPLINHGYRWIYAVAGAGRKAVLAADQFAKAMNFRSEMRMAAWVEGLGKADLQGLTEAGKVRYAENYVERVLAEPTDSLISRAKQNMFVNTFTAHGDLIKAMNRFANTNIIARIGAPYITVPANIIKQGFASSPFAPAVEWSIFRGTDDIERSMALAKMAFGTHLMAWTADKVSKGELFGHGPLGTMKNFWPGRKTPMAIKIGNNWYGYERIGPLADVISMAADATEMYYMSKDPNAQSRTFSAVTGMLAERVSEAPLISWFGNLNHVIDNARQEESGKALEEFITRPISGLIPDPIRQAAKWWDPRERVAVTSGTEAAQMDPISKFTHDMINELSLSIPGAADNRPAKRDWKGDFIYPPMALHDEELGTLPMRIINSMSPVEFYGQKKELDPVEDMFFRHHIVFNEKYDKMWAKDPNNIVTVSEPDQDRWRLLTAKGKFQTISPDAMNQHDTMKYLMDQDYFKILPSTEQAHLIHAVHDSFYHQAKEKIFESGDYQSRVINAAQQAAKPVPALPENVPKGLPPMGVKVPTFEPPGPEDPFNRPVPSPTPNVGVR